MRAMKICQARKKVFKCKILTNADAKRKKQVNWSAGILARTSARQMEMFFARGRECGQGCPRSNACVGIRYLIKN